MDPKTLFIVAITTAKMIMPGMPSVPGMTDFNAPTRTLTMDVTSDKKVDAQSTAECAIPGGLKLGPKVDLTINLPEKVVESGPAIDDKEEKSDIAEFKMKSYWGCSQTVPAGQPKVIDSKEITKSMNQAMSSKNMMKYKPRVIPAYDDGSHAYWPGKDNRKIAKDAACPGDYKLTTNYCGGTSITFDKPQDFLAPIDLLSPGKKIDLEKAVKVEWKKVPNAVGYIIYAFSGSEKEMVTWTSSSDPNVNFDLQNQALSKEKVEKYIKNGILLPADTTFCYIPEGIFKADESPMLTMTAVGVDKTQTNDGIETQVVVRSNVTMMLGKMDMGDEEIETPAEDQSEPNPDQPSVQNDNASDDSSNTDNGDTVDKANDKMDKADKIKDAAKRAKDLLKW